jgi:hypothetical protein
MSPCLIRQTLCDVVWNYCYRNGDGDCYGDYDSYGDYCGDSSYDKPLIIRCTNKQYKLIHILKLNNKNNEMETRCSRKEEKGQRRLVVTSTISTYT